MKDVAKTEDKKLLSNFLVPIAVNKSSLEQTINERIDGNIFDNNITEDKLQIKVEKVDDIRLDLGENTILYRVPLHIFVKKEMLLTDVAAEGDIVLDFETKYTLATNWDINTATRLLDYKWIKEPKANVLGFQIPVTAIAERVIRTSSKKLTDTIDKQVNESFDLKKFAEIGWNLAQNPILFLKEYDASFKFTPTGIALSPFILEKDHIQSTIFVQGSTQVGIGTDTNFVKNTALLPLQLQDFNGVNGFKLNLLSEVPYAEIEKVILKNFKGEEYGFGKNKLIIEDLKLSKKGAEMTIELKASGAYDGWLSLKGAPSYEQAENQLVFKDIKFSLDTKNFLLNSAKWVLSGLFTNQLAGSLVYNLDEDVQTVENMIKTQIEDYQIQDGVNLKGTVKSLKLNNALLHDESIQLAIQLDGAIDILIDKIP